MEDNGMGIAIGMRPPGPRKIMLKNPDGSVAATISFSKPEKKKVKRLNYNFKEISGQILRAKTCTSAKQVAVRARSKAAILRRQLKCGVYDDQELESAILHAEQMVRIAKKRMKHLEEEERSAKQKGENICEAELEGEEEKTDAGDMILPEDLGLSGEKMKELMQELQNLLEEMESQDGLEDLYGITAGTNLDPADLELMKKKHRADELREIAEADMKYLKAFFSKLERDRREVASGVSLQLSGVEMPVPLAPEEPLIIEGGSFDVMT